MQCQPNSKDHEYEMHNPKAHDGLFFTPAGQFKVVMDRCHLEDAAMEKSTAEDLDEDGDSFDVEQKAEEKESANFANGQSIHS